MFLELVNLLLESPVFLLLFQLQFVEIDISADQIAVAFDVSPAPIAPPPANILLQDALVGVQPPDQSVLLITGNQGSIFAIGSRSVHPFDVVQQFDDVLVLMRRQSHRYLLHQQIQRDLGHRVIGTVQFWFGVDAQFGAGSDGSGNVRILVRSLLAAGNAPLKSIHLILFLPFRQQFRRTRQLKSKSNQRNETPENPINRRNQYISQPVHCQAFQTQEFEKLHRWL